MRSDLLFNDTLHSSAITTVQMVSIDRIHGTSMEHQLDITAIKEVFDGSVDPWGAVLLK